MSRMYHLLQNLLLYYDSENSGKPIGVIFLEGCFCERVLNPVTGNAVGSGGNAGNNKSEKWNCTTDKMVRCFLNMVHMYSIPIPNESRLEFDFGYSIESTNFQNHLRF